MRNIEFAWDSFWLLEIGLNFLKRTNEFRELNEIIRNYLSFYFWFDLIGTAPCLFDGENYHTYYLKLFRFVHIYRLRMPIEYIMKFLLTKYSKKRQHDLTSFTILILYVVYSSHINCCIWLDLGAREACEVNEVHEQNAADGHSGTCQTSWRYMDDFYQKQISSQYIFAFYWIFEVITTVGYGDYVGNTSQEYLFSILLEFMGLTFFSFLMGSINGIFSTKDNFDDLIEEKLDSLDMWIKKIEKSNKPYHIQPTLYNDIRMYVEQALLYDFNLVIEEFHFY